MAWRSYSNLSQRQRNLARRTVLAGCRSMLNHRSRVHYTMGGQRWEGMSKRLRVSKGQYPAHSDCSSSSTWLLWNAITRAKTDLTIADRLNGQGWKGGYTGTLSRHGRRVRGKLLVGDLIFYGPGWPYNHVTVYVGGGMCFSHGGEAGPFKLPIRYRSDLRQVRRYI